MDFLSVIKIGGLIIQKAIDLHKAGVDQKVVAEVRTLIDKCHDSIDHHHKKLAQIEQDK